MKVHAPSDPAGDYARLIMVEMMPCPLVHHLAQGVEEDRGHQAVVRGRRYAGVMKPEYLPGYAFGWKDPVRLPRIDRRERHIGIFGRRRVLDKNGSSPGFYGLHPASPICSRAGEDDGDGPFRGIPGKGDEQFIDWQMRVLSRPGDYTEDAFFNPDIAGRWAEVKCAGEYGETLRCLLDCETRNPGTE